MTHLRSRSPDLAGQKPILDVVVVIISNKRIRKVVEF